MTHPARNAKRAPLALSGRGGDKKRPREAAQV